MACFARQGIRPLLISISFYIFLLSYCDRCDEERGRQRDRQMSSLSGKHFSRPPSGHVAGILFLLHTSLLQQATYKDVQHFQDDANVYASQSMYFQLISNALLTQTCPPSSGRSCLFPCGPRAIRGLCRGCLFPNGWHGQCSGCLLSLSLLAAVPHSGNPMPDSCDVSHMSHGCVNPSFGNQQTVQSRIMQVQHCASSLSRVSIVGASTICRQLDHIAMQRPPIRDAS